MTAIDDWYTLSMTTTIKVPNELRDRLKRQAALSGHTLGAHLERLADMAERDLRFAALKSAISGTKPDDRRSYESETTAWERAAREDASE